MKTYYYVLRNKKEGILLKNKTKEKVVMKEKVSVVIPIYNGQKYLQECLDSVLNQTYKNIEVILVNDGSTDDSLKICEKNREIDKRIVIVDKENGGVTLARKTGVKKATGKYVMFVDCDDWLDKDILEVFMKAILKENADIVVGGFLEDYENEKYAVKGGNLRFNKYNEQNWDCFCKEMFYQGVVPGWGIWPTLWAKLFRKDLIETSLAKLDERIFYGEDAACVFSACLEAKCVLAIENTGYHYRVLSTTSVSTKRNIKLLNNMGYLYDYLYNVFEQSEYRIVLLNQLSNYMVSIMNHAGTLLFHIPYHLQEIEWIKPQVTEWQEKYYALLEQIKSGKEINERYEQLEWALPFYEINKKNVKKLILYGAGAVGRSFYKQIKQISEIELTAWIDQRENIEQSIISREHLFEYEFDNILIAVSSPRRAEEMKNWLIDKGVDKENILWVKPMKIKDIFIKI